MINTAYTVEYSEPPTHRILRFHPSYCISTGTYYETLGIIYIKHHHRHFSEWRVSLDGSLCKEIGEATTDKEIKAMIDEAQHQVEAMMDRLFEFDDMRKAWGEVNKGKALP